MIITSLWEFLKAVEELPRKRGSSLYYRGHSNAAYKLAPLLFRHASYLNGEHRLFRERLNGELRVFFEERTAFEKLTKMRRAGIPTRLLDITKNPLAALYFACVGRNDATAFEHDGEVIMLSLDGGLIRSSDDDAVPVLSNLCKLKPKEKQFDTSLPPDTFNETENVQKLAEKIREENPGFTGRIDPKHLDRVLPVRAPKYTKRIPSQDGLFLLFGAGSGKVTVPDDWLVTTKSGEPLLIEAKSKDKIRKQLAEINISKKTLLPD
jgi:hypothetical protein